MWNPFKKDTQQNNTQTVSNKKDEKKAEDNSPKMNMLQRLAMKKMEKMSPQERMKMMQDFMKPENKGKLLSAMEMMRKTGQISEEQYNLAKQKLGE